MKNYIILLLFFGVFSKFKAQERIDLDRPDQTETPTITPKKYFQVEAGYVYEKTSAKETTQTLPTILFKYGIFKNTELRLITENEFTKLNGKNSRDFKPVVVGFKTNLVEENANTPAVSFLGHLTLNQKDDEAERHQVPEFRFLIDYELTQGLSIGTNLGMIWDKNLIENYVYTFTLAQELSPKITGFVEIYGFISPFFTSDHRADAGLTFFINSKSTFDISAGKGLSKISPNYFVGLGYSFRFKLVK